MENLLIRKAVPEDAERILEYLNQIGGESDNLLFGLNEFYMALEDERVYIESINNSKSGTMLIGIMEGEIVSVASIQGFTKKRIAHRGRMAISVKKSFWNQGIGTKMMTEIIDFAQKANITVVELEVKANNKNAIKLYEKFGFEIVGTYKNFFKIDEKFYDGLLMNLYL